jgi:hypothetical protein
VATSTAPQSFPLHNIANLVGVGVGVLSTVVTAVAGSGVLGGTISAKGNALVPLLGLIPGVLSGVLAFVAAKSVAVAATPMVTPVTNPKDNHGNPLKAVDSLGKLIGGLLG